MKKKWRCEMKDLKIQQIDKIPPPEEKNPELFYYDIRNSDIDNGYTTEKGVLVNNIGSLVTNKDILGDKEYIIDRRIQKKRIYLKHSISKIYQKSKIKNYSYNEHVVHYTFFYS